MRLAQWTLVAAVLAMVGGLALPGCKDKAASTGGGTGGGGAAVVLSSPKATLEAMHKAAEAVDMDGFAACVEPAYAAPMKKMVTAMKDFRSGVEKVANAAEAKFDKAAAEPFRDALKEMKPPSPLEKAVVDGKVDWTKVKIEEKGDTATAKVTGEAKDITFKKVGGKWYATPPESEGKTVEEMTKEADSKLPGAQKAVKALTELAKKITDGKVKKEDLGTAFQTALSGMGD